MRWLLRTWTLGQVESIRSYQIVEHMQIIVHLKRVKAVTKPSWSYEIRHSDTLHESLDEWIEFQLQLPANLWTCHSKDCFIQLESVQCRALLSSSSCIERGTFFFDWDKQVEEERSDERDWYSNDLPRRKNWEGKTPASGVPNFLWSFIRRVKIQQDQTPQTMNPVADPES